MQKHILLFDDSFCLLCHKVTSFQQNKYYLSKFRLKMKTIDEKNRISAICDSTYFLIIQSNF